MRDARVAFASENHHVSAPEWLRFHHSCTFILKVVLSGAVKAEFCLQEQKVGQVVVWEGKWLQENVETRPFIP